MAGEVLSRDERDGLLLRFPLEHLGSSHQKYLSDLLDTCDALELRAEAAEREVAIWKPMTMEEAEQALNDAEPIELTEEEAKRIADDVVFRASLEDKETEQLKRDRDVLVAAMRAIDDELRSHEGLIGVCSDTGHNHVVLVEWLRKSIPPELLNIAADAKEQT